MKKLAMVLMLGMCVLVGCASISVSGTHPERDTAVYYKEGNGLLCGTVSQDGDVWKAWAISDGVFTNTDHYFATQEEATKWLTTNWCKP